MPSVFASYSVFPTYKGASDLDSRVLGKVSDNYTAITTSFATGARVDPVVDDMDGDGVDEIIVSTSTGISLLEGDDVPNVASSMTIGEANTTPAICDIDNDGKKEVIAVTLYNGSGRAWSIGYTKASGLSVESSKSSNLTRPTSNVVCTPFSGGYTAMYIDALGNLNTFDSTGSTATLTVKDIEGSRANHSSSYYQDNLLVSDDLDPLGGYTAVWQSGRRVIAYFNDTNSTYYADTSDYSWSDYNYLLGGIDVSSGVDGFMSYPNYAYNKYVYLFKISIDPSNARSVELVKKKLWNTVSCVDSCAWSFTNAVTDTTGHTKMLGVGPSGSANMQFAVITPTNLSPSSWGWWSTAAGNVGRGSSSYAVRRESDSLDSITFAMGTSNNKFGYLYPGGGTPYYGGGSYSNTSLTVLFNSSTSIDARSPIPVDYNRDGYLDFITVSPENIIFLQSNAAEQESELSFTVTPNSSYSYTPNSGSDYRAAVEVQVGSPTTTDEYTYSVACDLTQRVLWNELFISGYNETARNTSVYGVSGSYTGSGYLAYGNGSVTMQKRGETLSSNVANITVILGGTPPTNANTTVQLVGLDPLELPVVWLDIVYNDTVAWVYSKGVAGSRALVVMYNLSNSMRVLEIDATLLSQGASGTVRAIGEGSTGTFGANDLSGTGISSILLYSSLASNESLLVYRLSLSSVTMPGTEYELANGAETLLVGDHYLVQGSSVPGRWQTVCYYDHNGTYTQRHYLSSLGSDPFTNFEDVTVQILSTGGILFTPGLSTSSIQNRSTDLINKTMHDVMNVFGVVDSEGGQFAIWSVLAVAIGGVLGVTVSPILGVIAALLTLLIGFLYGGVPVWVVITLVLLGATGAAFGMRKVFAGDE